MHGMVQLLSVVQEGRGSASSRQVAGTRATPSELRRQQRQAAAQRMLLEARARQQHQTAQHQQEAGQTPLGAARGAAAGMRPSPPSTDLTRIRSPLAGSSSSSSDGGSDGGGDGDDGVRGQRSRPPGLTVGRKGSPR
jgi:hypothetical protein